MKLRKVDHVTSLYSANPDWDSANLKIDLKSPRTPDGSSLPS